MPFAQHHARHLPRVERREPSGERQRRILPRDLRHHEEQRHEHAREPEVAGKHDGLARNTERAPTPARTESPPSSRARRGGKRHRAALRRHPTRSAPRPHPPEAAAPRCRTARAEGAPPRTRASRPYRDRSRTSSMNPAAKPNRAVPATIFFESRAVSARCSLVATRSPNVREAASSAPRAPLEGACARREPPLQSERASQRQELQREKRFGHGHRRDGQARRSRHAKRREHPGHCALHRPPSELAAPCRQHEAAGGRHTNRLSSAMPPAPDSAMEGNEGSEHEQRRVAPQKRPCQKRVARARRGGAQKRERQDHAQKRAEQVGALERERSLADRTVLPQVEQREHEPLMAGEAERHPKRALIAQTCSTHAERHGRSFPLVERLAGAAHAASAIIPEAPRAHGAPMRFSPKCATAPARSPGRLRARGGKGSRL